MLRTYLDEVRRARDGLAAAEGTLTATSQVLAGVARAVADHLGVELSGGCRLLAESRRRAPVRTPVPPAIAGPALLGAVHEALADPGERRSRGAHYTPVEVARLLVGRTLAELPANAANPPRVCDPAVGGGVFLLAAADRLAVAGVPRRHVVDTCLFGADIDRTAVSVAEAALALWAGDGRPPPAANLLVGDGLALASGAWSSAPPGGFDAVVGNPPFLGQLSGTTARTAVDRDRAGVRFGRGLRAYTDTAALFLLAGLDLVRPGGVVTLLQPESVLAARDAEGVRALVAGRAAVRALWLGGPGHFRAGVRVCAPVLVAGAGPAGSVDVLGPGGDRVARAEAPAGAAWAGLLATAVGVPDVAGAVVGGRLGDRFQATAGFRDEYYSLIGHVAEHADGHGSARGPRLVTTGLVDPGVCHWARRPVRFAGRSWAAPVVAAAALDGDARLGRWLRRVLVPKIVVAPQTKVVEAAVDEMGHWVPGTPLIAVTGPTERLWHVAAALCGPVVSAWAARQAAGTGLAAGTVRLRARQLLDAPLPPDGRDLDRAAAALRAASEADDAGTWRDALLEVGSATCRAHGVADEGLLAWWADRLPTWR